ncbi:hypothetical protein LTR86_003736 [Recurvomyces mirabilis]|nr:hypothetical protein LTR86_003736 [Recurvomyces mirabilis]
MSSSDQTGNAAVRKDEFVQRGMKEPNRLGTSIFFVSRLVDPFLQYSILGNGLANGLISRLGGTVLPQGPPLLTNTFSDRLGLSPYRSILLAMSVGSMAKQNFHVTTIMQERLKPSSALAIGIMNAVFNSVNSLLFLTAQTSASVNGEHFPQTPLIVGTVLYAVGLFIEWFSEIQRHRFKKDPANKGKVYQGGLFSLSRHVNYFGYMMWRTGYALAGGGWIWGAVVVASFTYSFTRVSIPDLQSYLEDRYGEQYQAYEQKVPYKFIPYLL